MLIAHWIYLAASVLSLLSPEVDETEPIDAPMNDDESVRTTNTAKHRRGTITKWTEQIRRNSSEPAFPPSRDGSVRVLPPSGEGSREGGDSFWSRASGHRTPSEEGPGESFLSLGAGSARGPRPRHARSLGQAARSRQGLGSGLDVSLGYLEKDAALEPEATSGSLALGASLRKCDISATLDPAQTATAAQLPRMNDADLQLSVQVLPLLAPPSPSALCTPTLITQRSIKTAPHSNELD